MYKVFGRTFTDVDAALRAQTDILKKKELEFNVTQQRNPIKKRRKKITSVARLPHNVEEERVGSFLEMTRKIRAGMPPHQAIELMHQIPEWQWAEEDHPTDEKLKKLQKTLLGSKYYKHKDRILKEKQQKRGILDQRLRFLERQEHEKASREKDIEDNDILDVDYDTPNEIEPSTFIAPHKYNIWFINGAFLHPYFKMVDGNPIQEGKETLDNALKLADDINTNKLDLEENQYAIVIPQNVIAKNYNLWKYVGECLIPYLYTTQDEKELEHLGTKTLEKAQELQAYLENQGEKVIVIPSAQEFGPNGEILKNLQPNKW